jgi:hypothetical protein
MPLRNSKRITENTRSLQKRTKTASGSALQPVLVDESHPKLPICTLPRKVLIAAASQATEDAPFESQLRDAIPEATIQLLAEGSRAATEATTEAIKSRDDGGFDEEYTDDFEGTNWKRLLRFTKLLHTFQTQQKLGKSVWLPHCLSL